MAGLLVSAGANIVFWEERSLEKNVDYEEGSTGGILNCDSHWNTLKFNPGGDLLACAEKRGSDLRILALQHAKEVSLAAVVQKDGVQYSCCEFMPSKPRYFMTGGSRGELNLWDMKNHTIVKNYVGHGSSSVTAVTSNDKFPHIISGNASGSVIIHTFSNSQPLKVLKEPGTDSSQAVNDLVLSPYENGMVAVASAGGGVSLWSGESQRQLGDFPLAHSSSASRVCFSPYNQMLLASCGTDGKIVFYDISQRKMLSKAKLSCPLLSLSLLNDGTTLVGGGGDGHLHIYDLRNCTKPINTIQAHNTPVHCLTLYQKSKARKTPRSSRKGTYNSSIFGASEPSSHSLSVGSGEVSSTVAAPDSRTQSSPSLRPGLPRDSHQGDGSVGKSPSLSKRMHGSGAERKLPDLPPKYAASPKSDKEATTQNISISSNKSKGGQSETGVDLSSQARLHSTSLQEAPLLSNRFADDIFSPVQIDGSIEGTTILSSLGPPSLSEKKIPALAGILKQNKPPSPQHGHSPHLPAFERVSSDLVPVTMPTLNSSTTMPLPVSTEVATESNSTTVAELSGGVAQKRSPAGHDTEEHALAKPSVSTRVEMEEYVISESSTTDILPSVPGQPFQVQFVQDIVEEASEEIREAFHKDMLHLYANILRHLTIQEKRLDGRMSRLESVLLVENQRLQDQNRKLYEENKRLKTLY